MGKVPLEKPTTVSMTFDEFFGEIMITSYMCFAKPTLNEEVIMWAVLVAEPS